jgi:hypothetical protein
MSVATPDVRCRIVSEALGYAGEFEHAMQVALKASDVAAEALGNKHFKAKALRKVC